MGSIFTLKIMKQKSRICFVIVVLDSWSQVLIEWDRDNPLQFPKQLPALVRQGIPEALRGEVWQRLTGASVQQVRELNYRNFHFSPCFKRSKRSTLYVTQNKLYSEVLEYRTCLCSNG